MCCARTYAFNFVPSYKIIRFQSDPESKLSPKAKEILHKVYNSSDRMFAMINGVLQYSTINATGHPTAKVDLQQVIAQIVQDLDILIQQKSATVQYQDLPVVEGAETLLYQLFSNLIINALKFSRANVPPVIELKSYSEKDQFVKIIVKDNGLGFNKNDLSKLEGMGLKNVRSRVRSYNGEVVIKSTVNKGTSYHITIPVL